MPQHNHHTAQKRQKGIIYDEIEQRTGVKRWTLFILIREKGAPTSSADAFCEWLNQRNEDKEQRRAEARQRRKLYVAARTAAIYANPERAAHARELSRSSYANRIAAERKRALVKKAKKLATPQGKIEIALRRRLYDLVRRGVCRKEQSAIALCGCSLADLQTHLESRFRPGMAWNNYGRWHIDHIRPCESFDLSDPIQQSECFHFSNLQPLWALENLSKGSKWNCQKQLD